MIKPKNRKERVEFIAKKKGLDFAFLMYSMTDGEVKNFFEKIYPVIKDTDDFDGVKQKPTCIRCGCEVNSYFTTECACGYNRAVYSEEDWKYDIENHSDRERLEEDFEFIANGYKIK